MSGRGRGVNLRFAPGVIFSKDVARSGVSSYFHQPIEQALAFPMETLGVIAQLVERLNGIEEVWGSNPHGSTKCCLDRVECDRLWKIR